jgi:hypothetical protein
MPHSDSDDEAPEKLPSSNSRVAELEKEQFLESLRQYKHVQPRVGKFPRVHQRMGEMLHMPTLFD